MVIVGWVNRSVYDYISNRAMPQGDMVKTQSTASHRHGKCAAKLAPTQKDHGSAAKRVSRGKAVNHSGKVLEGNPASE